ncbi:MAG: undecaprenyldiphospho-muramoylpentapeptide beta-N-acetylglucosaminyltransferase [Bacteroidales bacterium]|nr:undecaprenyldiphospho-muramoylpentapeptide beta-N-acetylglucosaminyltransferase [Bacteroidales bacterium]
MPQHKVKILISGGGTGGHIFPALAIANALKKKCDADILFVGALGRMEMKKIPEAGYQIEGLWISGIQRRITLKNILFPFKVIFSLIQALRIINKFKPDIAVGVGGYASGPALKVASKKGVPTLLQEQNSYPGITNKLLSKAANKICVAYEGMEKYFPKEKILITGNPVRKEIVDLQGKRKDAISYFQLNQNKTTLLIIGGSQGALSINESINANIELITSKNVQIIWQTGEKYYNTARNMIGQQKTTQIKVHAFIQRMDYAYAAADLVVSRAGAIAISELCAAKKPTIFVPFPHAAEDHQTKNAMALVKKNAALMVRDSEANERIGNMIINLIEETKQRSLLATNIAKLAHINAADVIADKILEIANKQ